MNNARLWTIVNPTVGVPLFFIGVMIASIYIHYMLLTNTNWFNGVGYGTEMVQIDKPNTGESVARIDQ